jgi:hypothetical protein
LLNQRLAKFGIVIDNQDCSLIGHRLKAPGVKRDPCHGRAVQHSALKEQAGTYT